MQTKKITEAGNYITKPRAITDEDLIQDYRYYQAQFFLKKMLETGLINIDEFNKITEKNRQTFSPYLAEIMV